MGGWGGGLFDNDDALDWVATLEGSVDLSVVRSALQGALGLGHVDAAEGSVAVAAAAVVAAAADAAPAELPAEISEWIAHTNATPTAADRDLALRAVLRARSGESELAQLWDEAADRTWFEQLDDLVAGLANIPSRQFAVGQAAQGPIDEVPAATAVQGAARPSDLPADVTDFSGRRYLDDVGAADLRNAPGRHEARWLVVNGWRGRDMTGLASWERLVDLETNDAHVERLDGVEQLAQLRHLHVGVRSGATLALDALAAAPELVSFGLYPADTVRDLSPLGHLTKLRRLWVGHETPTSARRLSEVPFHLLPRLEHLSWQGNGHLTVTLTDLSPLDALEGLRHVRLIDLLVDGPLDVLHHLPNLERIECTHLDAAAERERFAATRPDVNIDITRPEPS